MALSIAASNPPIENGTTQKINSVPHIFYDGYWIRYYEPPKESLTAKKVLLDALTRRTFHHTEPGINTPGEKLEDARRAYDDEACAKRKRVNAAMLAGALFNRATDIFTTIVNLEQKGISITYNDELMQECSNCFSEALELSQNVKHHSGEEGVDELWGEPVKVFTMSIAEYYCSRYRKIAQAMREIDLIKETIHQSICRYDWFPGSEELIDDFIEIAKQECEILRSDDAYFSIWPQFVARGEDIDNYRSDIPDEACSDLERHIKRGTVLLRDSKNLISWIANVRVPMPKSTEHFIERCHEYDQEHRLFADYLDV